MIVQQVGLYCSMLSIFICSHMYWTEHAAIGVAVTLYQLNLRDNTVVTLASSSSHLQLSPALALDGITDRLWMSDQSNGNILSCEISTGTLNCQVEVNTSLLLNSIPRSKLDCF